MTLVSRGYSDDHDHLRVMEFLRETFADTGSLENWLPPRFENNSRDMDQGIRMWEFDDKIIGLAVPEKSYVYFIQLHPDHNALYGEIVEWIEVYCKSNKGEKKEVKLSIIELDRSQDREQALLAHSFTKDRTYGIFRLRDVEAPISAYELPEGFSVRSATPEDFDEIAVCIRQVFGHGEWFTEEILEETARASFYHQDLDLVVVDEGGKIVSFCTFRFDPPSGITELEPMGTIEEYRCRGIGRALLCEGFRRLRSYNPSLLYIGGAADTPAANRLYYVTGFTEKIDLYRWEKLI
ncbi:MAG: GNAT family N-acetyltransferase [Candidatus Bathyarchaeia archaeon]